MIPNLEGDKSSIHHYTWRIYDSNQNKINEFEQKKAPLHIPANYIPLGLVYNFVLVLKDQDNKSLAKCSTFLNAAPYNVIELKINYEKRNDLLDLTQDADFECEPSLDDYTKTGINLPPLNYTMGV